MKLIFTERKVDISEDVRAYAEKKLSKLDRYFKNDAVANVKAGLERGKFWVEVTVKHDGIFFRATEKCSDLYQAIDSVQSTIDRQIRKNKTRLERRLREGAFEKETLVSHTEPVEEEVEFDIVRKKRFPVKPMAVEEAILQMNLLNHMFFVFRNMEKEDAFSVVYRRKDGGYGLIESSEE